MGLVRDTMTGVFVQAVKPDPTPVQIVYAGNLSNAEGVPKMLRALSVVDTPSWRIYIWWRHRACAMWTSQSRIINAVSSLI